MAEQRWQRLPGPNSARETLQALVQWAKDRKAIPVTGDGDYYAGYEAGRNAVLDSIIQVAEEVLTDD